MNVWKEIALPILLAGITFAGGYWGLQSTIEEQLTDHRELDIKMVDVALAILAGEKGSKSENQSVEARRFAVQILRQYSKLDETREGVKAVKWDEWAESFDKLQFDAGPVIQGMGWPDARYLSEWEVQCIRHLGNSPLCLNASRRKSYVPDENFELPPPDLLQPKTMQ